MFATFKIFYYINYVNTYYNSKHSFMDESFQIFS